MLEVFLLALLVSTTVTPQAEQPGIVDALTSLLEGFSAGAKRLIQNFSLIMTDLFIFVSRTVYTTLILGGVFLNFTRLNRRLGVDWIKGGIFLGLLSELAPYILKSLS